MKRIIYSLFLTFLTLQTFAQLRVGSDGSGHSVGNFPSVFSKEAKGGYTSRATIVERNAIPPAFRDTNMICYVAAVDSSYRLVSGINNANWQNIGPGNLMIALNNKITQRFASWGYNGGLTDSLNHNIRVQIVADPTARFGGKVLYLPQGSTDPGARPIYGPYLYNFLQNGQYEYKFGARISGNLSDTTRFLLIDVNEDSNNIIARKYIRYSDFRSTNAWSYFSISFIARQFHSYEFRVDVVHGDPNGYPTQYPTPVAFYYDYGQILPFNEIDEAVLNAKTSQANAALQTQINRKADSTRLYNTTLPLYAKLSANNVFTNVSNTFQGKLTLSSGFYSYGSSTIDGGSLYLKSGQYGINLTNLGAITANRYQNFQDKDGTVANLDDITAAIAAIPATPTPTLQSVTNSGNITTKRISTPGIDGVQFNNFVSQSTIPLPVSGQVNLGFVANSLYWAVGANTYTRTLRQLYPGNTTTRLPYLLASTLADSTDLYTNFLRKTGGIAESITGYKSFADSLSINGILPSLIFGNTATNNTARFSYSSSQNTFALQAKTMGSGGQGAAIKLATSGQYGTFNDSFFPQSGGLTIQTWLKSPTGTTGVFYELTGTNAIQIGKLGVGSVIVYWNGQAYNINKGVGWADGKFHNVAFTYDNATTVKLYIDGVLGATNSSVTFSYPTLVGATGGRFSRPATTAGYPMTIDQTLVYNRALSDAEIASNYNSGIGTANPTLTGIVYRWEFDNATGATVTDLTGHSNIALLGSPAWDLNGIVPQNGTSQLSTVLRITNGLNNSEVSTTYVGDLLGGTVIQGRSIRFKRPDGGLAPIMGADGHFWLDLFATASVPDANGSYNPFSAFGLATVNSTTIAQAMFASNTTNIIASANNIGGITFFNGHLYFNPLGTSLVQLDNNEGGTVTTGTTYQILANREQTLTANNAAQVVYTLPTTASYGDVIEIAGQGAGGWKLNQNAGDKIQGAFATTTGTGGSLAGIQGNGLRLRCIVANTGTGGTWFIVSHEGALTAL